MAEDLDLIKRKAGYNDMTPRQYCIAKIKEYRKHLEQVSEDYRELSEEEFTKRLEAEIRERENE